jgi:hypothetical protein
MLFRKKDNIIMTIWLLIIVTEETLSLSKSLLNLIFRGFLNLGKVKEPVLSK